MAESKESELARHLRESLSAASTDARLHPEQKKDTPPVYVEEAYKKIVDHAGGILGEADRQELLNPDSQYRYTIALQALNTMSAKNVAAVTSSSRAPNHTKGKVAEAYVELLKNKDKYGIEGATEEQILEAAWFSTGTDDSLHPEKIKANLIEKKQQERRSELEQKIKNKKALEMQYQVDAAKIAARGPSEKELRDERREVTIAYLENKQKDDLWTTSSSNSINGLYEIEGGIIGVAALGKGNALNSETKVLASSKIGELEKKIPIVGALIKTGDGAQFFTNPSGYLSSIAGGKVAEAVTGKLTAIATGRLAGTAIGAALGSIALGVGTIAGMAAGKYIVKAIDITKRNVKRIGQGIAGIGTIVLLGIQATPAAAAAAAGGTIITVIPLVVVILFILNAGGYVVPPGSALTTSGTQIGQTSTTVIENPYIRVVKTANPPGPFTNSSLPLSVQYTIIVTAKKETLTNVTFKYDCQVIKDGGGTCPPIDPAIPTSPPGGTIDTATPFTITYRQNYSVAFQNSLVMDNLTVSAKVASNPAVQEASGFASIIIGNPPTRCFALQGVWPARERGIMLTAIGQIVRAVTYTDKICNGGTVNLIYSSFQETFQGKAYGADTAYPNITFYPLALGSVPSAFYTLTHESGHILSHRSTLQDTFIQRGIPTTPEGRVCSYPFTYAPPRSYYEDFAESVAQYFAGQSLSSATRDFACMNGGNLYSNYQKHWCFMRKTVFENALGWNVNETVCQ